MKGQRDIDPKGLIFEAYQIEEISASECRSIFLDWALSLPDPADTGDVLRQLIADYAEGTPDHPMSVVLRDGLTSTARPRRRGGWKARPRA